MTGEITLNDTKNIVMTVMERVGEKIIITVMTAMERERGNKQDNDRRKNVMTLMESGRENNR